jgi:hypothetical protein
MKKKQAQAEAPAHPPKGMKHAEAKHHGDPVNLTSEDGKHTLTAQAMEGGVGIWVGEAGSTRCVHLVSMEGQGTYLGFHPENAGGACPLAFYLDDQGKPHMQLAHDGHTHMVALHDLFDLIARVEKLEAA